MDYNEMLGRAIEMINSNVYLEPTTYKPNLQSQLAENAVEWNGKWRNVVFTKGGGQYVGIRLHDSAAAAKKIIDDGIAKWAAKGKLPLWDSLIPHDDVLFILQMPVKE